MGINRRFGLVLVAACGLAYGWSLWSGGAGTAWLVAAVVFLGITLTVPGALAPAKDLWLRFGSLLHAVVSPVLLVLFFFTVVVPIGLGLRLFGKDPLRLRRPTASNWVERQPPGPPPASMTEVY